MSNNNSNRPPSNRPPTNRRPTQPPQQQSGSGVLGALKIGGTVLRVLVTVGLCVFLAMFILSSASDLFGLNQVDNDFKVDIPENMTISQLSNLLKSSGIVDQKFTFDIYANLNKDEITIKPGTYVINSNMAYDEIFSILRTGDLESMYVSLSFREGIGLTEIAQILDENGVCNGEEFLEYVQTEDFSGYSFFNLIPKDEQRYFKLEGYLFPDTYEFYRPEKVSSVADKFLANFNIRMDNSNITSRMEALGMTLDEVVTLASLIEKEASDPAQMRRVSSVFHNRLKNESFPNLQSDVTTFYIEDNIKDQNRSYTIASTQEVYDAYNTYVCKGLPIGPVASPGEDAIMAALYPAETNYYYFVTNVDGDYYFSTSLNEHDTNVALAKSQDESGEEWVGGIRTHAENVGGDAAK